MTIITNADLKSWLNVTDTNDDPRITFAVNAANTAVTTFCARTFDKTAVGAETARVYAVEPISSRILFPFRQVIAVDDFWDVTNLVIKTDEDDDGIFETTWATTDYQLEPLNGLDGPMAVPYWRIRAVSNRRFPTYGRRAPVQVTAAWGWSSVPSDVIQGTLIKAARLFKRKDSPEGILGGWVDGGTVRVTQREDPDTVVLLRPYCRTDRAALVG